MNKPLNIYVVVNCQTRRNELIRTINAMGHQVIGLAGDALGARMKLTGIHTDLLIMDHAPPNLQGPAAARTILETGRLPILLLHRERNAVAALVRAGIQAGVLGVYYWDQGTSALETAITFTVAGCQQELEVLELSLIHI